MKTANIIRCAFVMLASGALALADGPTTRPAPNPNVTRPQMRAELRALATARTNNVQPATRQEWDEMMAFLDQNSPSRAYVLRDLDRSLSMDAPIRLDLIRQWRAYTFLNEHFPKIAELRRQRFQLEDELFVLESNAKRHPDEQDGFREKIQAKVHDLAQLTVDEQQIRVDNIKQMLAQQQQKLGQLQSSEDQSIEQRTQRIMDSLHRPASTRPSNLFAPQGDAGSLEMPVATDNDPIPADANATN